MTQRVSSLPADPTKALSPVASKKGFFQTHFGNPEKDEICGATDNDYESEPEQMNGEH